MNIGAKIRRLRKNVQMTTIELAAQVNTTQQTISNYENNKSEPAMEMLESICEALGITLADFFAAEQPELAPEFRRLLESAKKLTPRQRKSLQTLLDAMNKE